MKWQKNCQNCVSVTLTPPLLLDWLTLAQGRKEFSLIVTVVQKTQLKNVHSPQDDTKRYLTIYLTLNEATMLASNTRAFMSLVV